jgi:hypothetical protein
MIVCYSRLAPSRPVRLLVLVRALVLADHVSDSPLRELWDAHGY